MNVFENILRVLILTEGDLKTGLGHAARCGALYDASIDAGLDAELLICGDCSVSKVLAGKNWRLHDWISVPPNRKQGNYSNDRDMVFIDSYRASDSTLTKYAECYKNFVLLDDHAVRRPSRGIIVTPVNFAELLSFPQNPLIQRIIGPDFILLRRPFWNAQPKTISSKIRSVFVGLGGGDTHDTLMRVLDAIRNELPRTRITVVTGHQSREGLTEELKLFPDVHMRSDMIATDVHSIMMQSDIAVAAGGQTLYELACLGVPAIAISIADNQELAVRAFTRSGYLLDELSIRNVDLHTSVRRQLQLLRDWDVRQKLSRIGQSIVDGKGAQRLVHALIEKKSDFQ